MPRLLFGIDSRGGLFTQMLYCRAYSSHLLTIIAWVVCTVWLAPLPAADLDEATAPSDTQTQALSFGVQRQLDSAALHEQRLLNLWLPPSYAQQARSADAAVGADPSNTGVVPDKTYPVLYLLDGSVGEDFFHIAGLVSFLATYQLMPETIVVGIANVDRKRDFTTPSGNAADRQDIPQHGGSAHFIEFLGSELIPWMAAHYPVNGERTLLGQSLGGLLATQVLLNKPQLFNNYLIVSPSLWWDDKKLLATATSLLEKQAISGRQVYLAVGFEHPEIVGPTYQLHQTLIQQSGTRIRSQYDFLASEDHATALHQAAYRGFIWFYKSNTNELVN